MCGTSNRNLPLINESAGCSCCPPRETTTTKSPARTVEAGQAKEFHVAGMTCGHCVPSVSAELDRIDGVRDVQIALVPDGLSTVTIQSAGEVSREAVRDAVSDAGYEVIGTV